MGGWGPLSKHGVPAKTLPQVPSEQHLQVVVAKHAAPKVLQQRADEQHLRQDSRSTACLMRSRTGDKGTSRLPGTLSCTLSSCRCGLFAALQCSEVSCQSYAGEQQYHLLVLPSCHLTPVSWVDCSTLLATCR